MELADVLTQNPMVATPRVRPRHRHHKMHPSGCFYLYNKIKRATILFCSSLPAFARQFDFAKVFLC